MNKLRIYFRVISSISQTSQRISDYVTMALKKVGFTEPQYNILRILQQADTPSMSSQTLMESMIQRSSNVTRIVDKLIEKGLVERKPCEENRRKVEISLTNTGRNQLKTLDQIVYDLHKSSISNMAIEELEELQHLIKKLNFL